MPYLSGTYYCVEKWIRDITNLCLSIDRDRDGVRTYGWYGDASGSITLRRTYYSALGYGRRITNLCLLINGDGLINVRVRKVWMGLSQTRSLWTESTYYMHPISRNPHVILDVDRRQSVSLSLSLYFGIGPFDDKEDERFGKSGYQSYLYCLTL